MSMRSWLTLPGQQQLPKRGSWSPLPDTGGVREIMSATPSGSEPAGDRGELHVLAVDDSSVDRKLIEHLLRASSYRVTTAESGERALELLGATGNENSRSPIKIPKVNMIITDYCMPEMSGYDLLKKVKESSALREIPVVVVSSENVPNRISRCLEEGAEDFLLKPLQQADVCRLRSRVTTVSNK